MSEWKEPDDVGPMLHEIGKPGETYVPERLLTEAEHRIQEAQTALDERETDDFMAALRADAEKLDRAEHRIQQLEGEVESLKADVTNAEDERDHESSEAQGLSARLAAVEDAREALEKALREPSDEMIEAAALSWCQEQPEWPSEEMAYIKLQRMNAHAALLAAARSVLGGDDAV